ncbi:hypothetical protein Tsubulata_028685 [Turnera subulata]|uniref:Kinesin motor domain-containing protein n=1 Tax=Turnera subulata TaxID=218843 RepID=A0A9Q0JCB1_9ROSI|nr:hypothetical protein Tsubulata_028685 [Turnera subulata]
MGVADEEESVHAPKGGGGDEKILVSVRVRPLNEKELSRNDVSDWECINDDTIIYRNNLSISERSMYPSAYTFDRVFRPDCSTRQVYDEGAKEVALAVVSGINSSIFAYGQTSSGKTYTMCGITEFTVADIYDYIERHKEREFILKFSAMEIYNEAVRDLLSSDTTPLRLLDDPERGTVVERLTEETLRDWDHFRELLSICEAQRQIGETSLNETSSRSHQILRLTIESSAREFLSNDKSSTLAAAVNFIDLAGSERASQTLSAGTRLKEGCHINRSLLTLGTVIRKLSKGRNGHIPFRDSKLTRILQSSLGGNARTAIICTMSPARTHVEQSRNTLLFASCAKEVTTNAQVNVVMSDKALVKQLQRELSRLEGELRSTRPNTVTVDSSAIVREKDIEIEQLKKEVAELSRQLDIARSQIENLLREAEDDRASTWEDPDCHYPRLRVRSSFRSDSASYSVISEDRSLVGVRSFDASQFSDRRSSSSSDGNFIQLSEFEQNFLPVKSSPRLSIPASAKTSPEPSIHTSDFARKDLHQNENVEQAPLELTDENFDTICKEVQCIKVEESSPSRHSRSNMSNSRQHTYAASDMSSPTMEMGTPGLSEVRNADCEKLEMGTYAASDMSSPKTEMDTRGLVEIRNDDSANVEISSPGLKEQKDSPGLKEHKEFPGFRSDFILPSPEKPSPWLLEESMSSSRSLSMMRSRSCRARLLSNFPTYWVEKIENNESTPPFGFEKEFPGRPEGYQMKYVTLKYGPATERISSHRSENSMGSPAADELNIESIEALTDRKSTSPRNSNARIKCMVDSLAQETTKEEDVSAKSVKDVGLDPIQDDVDAAPKWPAEFVRMRQAIIELWNACNISLVHRTYFFLLFKGDPSDSFYMEVEHRRLSFLKSTFAKGNKPSADGRILTPTSSKKALDAERQMLCGQMQKRFSREERENLFLKWGISLSASNRRFRLVHALWTNTTDMDHITQSAAIVAKLVGFEEQEQALKEMFGLLNFTPKSPLRKKTSFWRRNFSIRY